MPADLFTDAEERRILLIDAGSIIHPAYHVLKDFSTSQGFPTGAIFGFTRTLMKLLREYSSRYMAVAFDAKGETRRHQRYEEYKAQRPAMANDLAVQIPRIQEIVEALGIPRFEMAGYEADDLVATLARLARERGLRVLIVSSDKDLMQLVGDGAVVLKPRRDMRGDVEALDAAGVEKYLGVPPDQVQDYLALVGDAVDNVPGVPGIGEVTARKLLQRYHSLEEILKHAGQIENKRAREALHEHQDLARLSYELVELETAPLSDEPDPLERCRVGEPDWEHIRGIFRELEFQSLLRELGLAEPEEAPPAPEIDVEIIMTREALKELEKRLSSAEEISLDLETTSEDEMQAEIVGVALALGPHRGAYIPVGHEEAGVQRENQLRLREVLEALRPHLEGGRPGVIGQNLKYDAKVLRRAGVDLKNITFDSLLAAYLLDPTSRKDLKELAMRYLGESVRKFKELGEERMSDVAIEEAAKYAAADAEVVLRLKRVMLPRLRENGLEQLFYDVELPLLPVLVTMELTGILLDPQMLAEQAKELEVYLDQLRRELFQLAGQEFNPNSPKQVAHILFDVLGLPVVKKTKTGPSTDATVLEQLAVQHPLPEKLLAYRELEKLLNTYVRKLPEYIHPETGRIHTSFNQSVTATGRLSSSSPNLQNIPVRGIGAQIRRAFVVPPGRVLIGADYSQIELRVMAHITGDRGLIEAFERDEDIHTRTAATIFGTPLEDVTPEQRDIAKRINFGIAYGMSAYGLAQWAKISRKEAEEFIQSYFASFPGVKTYMERVVQQAEETGYVESLLGRKRYFHGRLDNRMKREAINMPIQGCLPYETRLLTSEGYLQIGELYEKDRRDLKVWTGRSFAPFKVINRGPCELAELELANGHILRCDTRHEVLVIAEEGYRWKSYPQLKPGDRICLNLPQEIEFKADGGGAYEYSPDVHKGLIEYLTQLGMTTQATAATKRIPEFIFRGRLHFRKAFLRGVLDSDGYAGSNGATNPSIHLCQRELLEDLWLLFRTIGVESKIRGPYYDSGRVSYRLDLVGGMLERALGFSGRSQIRIPSMQAPQFLVEAFLKSVAPSQFSSHSHRVIYSRLRHEGTTSIYTLAEMVKAAGVNLTVPLYAWSPLREKRSLGVEETTYTLAVEDPLHRFDSEGVISKNTAADLMKLAMIRAFEKIKAGRLPADMLLQIHDELIFEADERNAAACVPGIKETMEGVMQLRVPLKADVKVGKNWGEI